MLVSSVFLLGGFVVVTCILRIVYSYNPKSPAIVSDFSRAILWVEIEIGTAFVCACLPTLMPIITPILGYTRSWYHSITKNTAKSGNISSFGESRLYNRFDDGSDSTRKLHLTEVGTGKVHGLDGRGKSFPLDKITVESRVDVV